MQDCIQPLFGYLLYNCEVLQCLFVELFQFNDFFVNLGDMAGTSRFLRAFIVGDISLSMLTFSILLP